MSRWGRNGSGLQSPHSAVDDMDETEMRKGAWSYRCMLFKHVTAIDIMLGDQKIKADNSRKRTN